MRANSLSLQALKRLYHESKVYIVSTDYQQVGDKHKRTLLGGLMARWTIHATLKSASYHNMRLSTQAVRDSIRQNLVSAAYDDHKEAWLLKMQLEWYEWKPSRLLLDNDDIGTLTTLALKGSKVHGWEPDWRLYGAGLIDLAVERTDTVGFHEFRVSISDLGRTKLEEAVGMTIAELRDTTGKRDADRQRELESYFIRCKRTVGRRGMVFVDFTCEKLGSLTVTYSDSTQTYSFKGSVKGDLIGSHMMLENFLIGINRMVGSAVNNTADYYDLNTGRVVYLEPR